MEKLLQAIRAFEKAGEELSNIAAVSSLERKLKLDVKEGRELMDRIAQGSIMGARAERSILEAVALGTAMEILKQKIAEENKSK